MEQPQRFILHRFEEIGAGSGTSFFISRYTLIWSLIVLLYPSHFLVGHQGSDFFIEWSQGPFSGLLLRCRRMRTALSANTLNASSKKTFTSVGLPKARWSFKILLFEGKKALSWSRKVFMVFAQRRYFEWIEKLLSLNIRIPASKRFLLLSRKENSWRGSENIFLNFRSRTKSSMKFDITRLILRQKSRKTFWTLSMLLDDAPRLQHKSTRFNGHHPGK